MKKTDKVNHLPVVLSPMCEGEYEEYGSPLNTLELYRGQYKVVIDERAYGLPDAQDVVEEYGTFTVKNGCEIFLTQEREVANGKEVPREDIIMYHNELSIGYWLEDRIVEEVTDVKQKGDSLVLVFNKEEFTLNDGICTAVSKGPGLFNRRKKKEGRYTRQDDQIIITFEKFQDMFVEYEGWYYFVDYVRK